MRHPKAFFGIKARPPARLHAEAEPTAADDSYVAANHSETGDEFISECIPSLGLGLKHVGCSIFMQARSEHLRVVLLSDQFAELLGSHFQNEILCGSAIIRKIPYPSRFRTA
jgi:hypothetical protein